MGVPSAASITEVCGREDAVIVAGRASNRELPAFTAAPAAAARGMSRPEAKTPIATPTTSSSASRVVTMRIRLHHGTEPMPRPAFVTDQHQSSRVTFRRHPEYTLRDTWELPATDIPDATLA